MGPPYCRQGGGVVGLWSPGDLEGGHPVHGCLCPGIFLLFICICICMRLSCILSGQVPRQMRNCLDMNKNTLKTLAKITHRIDTLCDKAATNCGHPAEVEDFLRYRDKVLRFIASEFSKGVEK